MRRITLHRPSPAIVVAILALFVAASGGALAAQGGSHQASSPSAAAAKKKKPKSKRGPRGRRGPRGPEGPRGSQGAQGPAGLPGPAGPSQAFAARNDGPTASTADGTDVTVATLGGLPAGAYLITAKANITRLTGTPGVGSCTLTAEGDADGSNVTLQNTLTIGSVVFTQLTHTFPGPGSATLSCTANGGGNWAASQIKVVAVKLGSESKVLVTG